MLVVLVISLITTSIYFFYISLIRNIKSQEFEPATNYSPLHYAIIIPCLNESKVIEATLERLLSNLGNRDASIYLVDDDSDDDTVEKIKKFTDKRIKLIEKKKPNAQKGKGHSLNLVFEQIKQDFLHIDDKSIIVTIIDSDGFLCDEAFYIADSIFMDPTNDAAQARVKILRNKYKYNFLINFQDIEFFEIIDNIQRFRMHTDTVGLGGNGQFTRLSALKELETPWSPCLLEDYDLTIRMLLNGHKIIYTGNLIIFQQGLTSYKRYVKQRSRWVQGSIQCIKYVPKILSSSNIPTVGKVEMLYFLLQPFMNLINIFIIAVSAYLILSYIIFHLKIHTLISLILMLLITVYPGYIFSKRYCTDINRINETTKYEMILIKMQGLLMYVYTLLTIPSVLLAFFRQIFGFKSWIKTEREEDS